MKKLKRKVLFTLNLGSNVSSGNEGMALSYQQLYSLINFEKVSIRGAVSSLRDDLLVNVYTKQSKVVISLTVQGKEALKRQFPGLNANVSSTAEVWTICTLFGNSKSDYRFKKTKEAMLRNDFLSLGGLLFISPSKISEKLANELEKLKTFSNVLGLQSKSLQYGDPYQVFSTILPYKNALKIQEQSKVLLTDLNIYLNQKKYSTNRALQLYILLLNKMMELLTLQIGLPYKYLPQDLQIESLKAEFAQTSIQILTHTLSQ